MGNTVNGCLQGCKVGEAVLVLDDDLAVDKGRLALEFEAGLDHAPVLVAPVMAAAGECAYVAAIDPQQSAEAVVFDFVNPAVALGRLGGEDRHLGSDELGDGERTNSHGSSIGDQRLGVEWPTAEK